MFQVREQWWQQRERYDGTQSTSSERTGATSDEEIGTGTEMDDETDDEHLERVQRECRTAQRDPM
jgi:hypothetical protein